MAIFNQLGLHGGTATRLASVIGFTYAFQAAFAAYAVPNQTEKYYDLAGSLGFLSSTLLSLYPSLRANGSFSLSNAHPRQLIVSGMVLFWAGRLGTFLYQRISMAGHDSRFDEIKKQPAVFTFAWMAQATWITIVTLPVLLLNSMPPSAHPALRSRDAVAVGVWAAGMGLEIVADNQKSAWRKAKDEKKHEEKFISSGVWALSRHPNYLGEVILQFGPALLAQPSLLALPVGWRAASFLPPVFSYVLLRYGSGVPPLEKSAEKKWGSDEGWRKYTETTSVLVPWPAGLGKGKAA